MKVKIYGSSDDNVIVEGGTMTDEFGAYNSPVFLHFNEGTIIRAEYSPDDYRGKWKIESVKEGTATSLRTPAPDDNDDYSDIVTMAEVESVKCWDQIEGPTEDDLVNALAEMAWATLSQDQLRRIFAICDEK